MIEDHVVSYEPRKQNNGYGFRARCPIYVNCIYGFNAPIRNLNPREAQISLFIILSFHPLVLQIKIFCQESTRFKRSIQEILNI